MVEGWVTSFWDWAVSGFCNPSKTTTTGADESSSRDDDDEYVSWLPTFCGDGWGGSTTTKDFTTRTIGIDPDKAPLPMPPGLDSLKQVWEVQQEVPRTKQLTLQHWSLDHAIISWLKEQTHQWAPSDRLVALDLQWCFASPEDTMFSSSYDHFSTGNDDDDTEKDELPSPPSTIPLVVKWIESNGTSMQRFGMWNPLHVPPAANGTSPSHHPGNTSNRQWNEQVLWHILHHSIPNNCLPALQHVELSYFDLRIHMNDASKSRLGAALCRAIASSSWRHLDVSFCKTNTTLIHRLVTALRTSPAPTKALDKVQPQQQAPLPYWHTLSLCGMGLDTAMLQILVQHGLLWSQQSTNRLAHLQELHLAHNRLTPDSIPFVIAILSSSSSIQLQVLHLRGNSSLLAFQNQDNTNDSSFEAFVHAIANHATFHTLSLPDLSGHPDKDNDSKIRASLVAATTFANGLAASDYNGGCRLQSLDLSDSTHLPADPIWLVPLLLHLPRLETLMLPASMTATDCSVIDRALLGLSQDNWTLRSVQFGSGTATANQPRDRRTDDAIKAMTSTMKTASPLSPQTRSLLERNHCLYQACFRPESSPHSHISPLSLPVSQEHWAALWPLVLHRLQSTALSGWTRQERQVAHATSVYCFLQTCFCGTSVFPKPFHQEPPKRSSPRQTTTNRKSTKAINLRTEQPVQVMSSSQSKPIHTVVEPIRVEARPKPHSEYSSPQSTTTSQSSLTQPTHSVVPATKPNPLREESPTKRPRRFWQRRRTKEQ